VFIDIPKKLLDQFRQQSGRDDQSLIVENKESKRRSGRRKKKGNTRVRAI